MKLRRISRILLEFPDFSDFSMSNAAKVGCFFLFFSRRDFADEIIKTLVSRPFWGMNPRLNTNVGSRILEHVDPGLPRGLPRSGPSEVLMLRGAGGNFPGCCPEEAEGGGACNKPASPLESCAKDTVSCWDAGEGYCNWIPIIGAPP